MQLVAHDQFVTIFVQAHPQFINADVVEKKAF